MNDRLCIRKSWRQPELSTRARMQPLWWEAIWMLGWYHVPALSGPVCPYRHQQPWSTLPRAMCAQCFWPLCEFEGWRYWENDFQILLLHAADSAVKLKGYVVEAVGKQWHVEQEAIPAAPAIIRRAWPSVRPTIIRSLGDRYLLLQSSD